MTNVDSVLKSRTITLLTKVYIVKAMVCPVAMYRCECWTIKKAEHWKIDGFELWCWRRPLRVPWTAGMEDRKRREWQRMRLWMASLTQWMWVCANSWVTKSHSWLSDCTTPLPKKRWHWLGVRRQLWRQDDMDIETRQIWVGLHDNFREVRRNN